MQGRSDATLPTPRSTDLITARAPLRACAFVFLISVLQAACTPQHEVVIHARQGPVRVRVELALTPAEHERGLMYRQTMPKGAGMLFVFAESEVHGFWMKNTPLPLDMIFIDDDKEIVGIVENTVPFSTTNRTIGRPSRYVLEVNGGFATEHGIKSGQTVDLPELPPSR